MPGAMPKVLADRRDQRLASERAEEMVRRAEEEQERRGNRQAGGKRGSKGSTSSSAATASNDNENFFLDSAMVAEYFNIGLVPRVYPAFEDFRWDLIMQGMGLETILVHNCKELSRAIDDWEDPVERHAMQRLLRRLHALMVKFQSQDPLQWIDAAYMVKDWFQADRDWNFFDEGSTQHGSEKHEEGEEESQNEDDSIDPQDELLHGDRWGPRG